jgi:cytoskeleton protein RodZ
MSIGSDLSAGRKAAGLTLEDIADRTRVRRTVIERIEADDFSLCGGDVYARGHVRTIATVVGIDPAPLVAEFDRLHVPQGPSASEVFEADTSMTRERRAPNWTAAMAVALVVVAVIAVFEVAHGGSSGTTVGHQGASSTPVVSQHSTPAAPASTPPPSPTTTPSPTVIAKVPSPGGDVTVRLEVISGRTWISATAGGNKAFEGVLNTGAVKVFTDAALVKLVIGNAGAVKLTVNGVDVGSPGGTGQVVRLSFDPGDPTASG